MMKPYPIRPISDTSQHEFLRGIKDCMPIMMGIMPFGLILGAQATQKGMSWLETVLMMGMNFAGGSEFAVVSLWSDPLPIVLIVTTTFMINSRHILMGAALAPHLRHLPKHKLLPTLFVMVDESWALFMAEIKRREQLGLPTLNLPYYWGTAVLLYLAWILCGYLGSIMSPMLGNVDQYGFGMAFPAVFLVLIRSMWRGFQAARPWFISLIMAIVVYTFIPTGSWYVISGTIAGLLFAYLTADEKQNETT